MLCACGEKSELEECTYSFSHFEAVPGIENDGIKVYYCDYCNARNVVTIPAHDCYAYTDFRIDENGNHYGNCTYEGCERYIDEPHNLELLEELDENSHKHICAACGYYEAEDHLFVEFEFIDEDTHEAYCECGYTVVKPHEYFEFSGNNDGETHTGYCYCGAEITGDHNWSDWNDTANGHMRTCDVCGAEEHGAHQWDDWYGISMLQHQHECQVCHRFENVDHVWDNDWVNRGENGHSQDCLDCGWRITEDHEFAKCGDNGDGTHTGYCFCGAEVTGKHNWGYWEEAEDGSGTFHTCNDCYATEYCSHEWSEWYGISNLQHQHQCEICGTTKDSRHTWDDWTDNGTTHSHECTGCGWRITEEHDYINISDDENGTTHTAYCICGKGITSEHDWSPWIDTENGQHRRECNECGAEEIGEHNLGEYSKDGVNHTAECTDCHAIVSEGHTYGDYEYVDGETHQRNCSVCNYTEVTAHKPNLLGYTDNSDGTHSATCGKCSKKYYVEHTYVCGKYDEEKHTLSCDECDAWEFEIHNWSEWELSIDGSRNRYCLDCGEQQSCYHENKTYTESDGQKHKVTCDNCGWCYSELHENEEFISQGDGTHKSACRCGYWFMEDHFYICEDNGNGTHTGTCGCGEVVTESHNYDFETVILREPTDGRPGSKREYCSCGAYKNSSFVSYYDINGDDVIDEMDYQLLVNEILKDANEQSGTAEYDEIIKYDLDGDGYLDVLDASIMALVVNCHKSIWEVQNTTRGDFDLDGVAFTDDDLVGMYHILSNIDSSAPTLSTSQKFAADLNFNGKIDEEDCEILEQSYSGIEATACEENVKVYYRWGNNYTTCTATAMCTLCNKKVVVETVNSVQNADGSYTATFTNTLLGTKTFKKQ